MSIHLKSILFVCIISFCGCNTKHYKLSSNDLKWNPYKKNDILIFKSNKDEIDTLLITNISKGEAPNDPMSLSPKYYYEWLHVGAEWKKNHESFLFMQFAASEDSNCGIDLSMVTDKAKFYSDSNYYSRNAMETFFTQLIINNLIYDDVIKISPSGEQKYEGGDKLFMRENFITTLYWSKSKGCVRFDLKNGYYRELVESLSGQ